jgi:hypothetical protein
MAVLALSSSTPFRRVFIHHITSDLLFLCRGCTPTMARNSRQVENLADGIFVQRTQSKRGLHIRCRCSEQILPRFVLSMSLLSPRNLCNGSEKDKLTTVSVTDNKSLPRPGYYCLNVFLIGYTSQSVQNLHLQHHTRHSHLNKNWHSDFVMSKCLESLKGYYIDTSRPAPKRTFP